MDVTAALLLQPSYQFNNKGTVIFIVLIKKYLNNANNAPVCFLGPRVFVGLEKDRPACADSVGDAIGPTMSKLKIIW